MKDNQQLDHLFKDKLASAKVTPPAGAWDAIATNVNSGKSKKGIYFFIAVAASFSLLCTFTWMALTTESNDTSVKLAEVSKIQPEFAIQPEKVTSLKVNIPNPQIARRPNITTIKENDPLIEAERISFSVGIQPIDRRNISFEISNAIPIEAKVSFVLPPFITDPKSFQEPRGLKFNFIRSLASVAKGVNEGQKALSQIRKTKIEFINEELKLDDPEKKSKAEATLQEDSPSNQQ